MSNLYQETTTGKLVEMISKHDKEYGMVKDSAGDISYIGLDKLLPYDANKGRLSNVTPFVKELEEEEKQPESVVPIEDIRLNLNTAPAEQIAKRLPGVGFATAKKVVELRMSLSGERFSNLKQLENIPRVNWEQLIADDLIFIS